jgi:hypothetical protein
VKDHKEQKLPWRQNDGVRGKTRDSRKENSNYSTDIDIPCGLKILGGKTGYGSPAVTN